MVATVPQLQRVALHAAAAGLSPLIPIPFVDDIVIHRIRQHMVRAVLGVDGGELPDHLVFALAGVHVPEKGTVERLARIAVAAPVKRIASKTLRKVSRKVALVLRVKECVDAASTCLHHGWLLQYAWTRGHLDAALMTHETHVQRVYAAMDAACAEMDPRPLEQLLRRLLAGGRVLGAAAARALAARRKGESLKLTPDNAGALWELLVQACWEEQGYFKSLAQRYERHLEAPMNAWPPSRWIETYGMPTSSG